MYNHLASKFGDVVAVIEEPVPRLQLARRRAKRLGWTTVAGQMAFVALVMPLLNRLGQTRIDGILVDSGSDTSEIPDPRYVDSVNSAATIQLLRDLHPAVIVVNGTRDHLKHCALCDRLHLRQHPRRDNSARPGSTAATGRYGITAVTWPAPPSISWIPGSTQEGCSHKGRSRLVHGTSFATYPYLHLACGLPLLTECVEKILNGETPPPVKSLDDSGDSTLRWHPTLWGYLRGRLADHVK